MTKFASLAARILLARYGAEILLGDRANECVSASIISAPHETPALCRANRELSVSKFEKDERKKNERRYETVAKLRAGSHSIRTGNHPRRTR
jgi:hypothetical protein